MGHYPEEIIGLPESEQRRIMSECQEIIRAFCDKVIVYADGNIMINGLIEVSTFDVVSVTSDEVVL